LDLSQSVLGVREHSDSLFVSYARKPLQKSIYRCAGFEIFEQGSHRSARTTKNPGTAEFIFATFHLWTIDPIQHDDMICSTLNSRNSSCGACK
jgi:hypothetical protein